MTKPIRKRSPQEKKEADYRFEIRPDLEAPHAFRKNWPRKKARVNRSERRRTKAAIASDLAYGDEDDITPNKIKTIRVPHAIRKSYVMSLRERLEWKRRKKAAEED